MIFVCWVVGSHIAAEKLSVVGSYAADRTGFQLSQSDYKEQIPFFNLRPLVKNGGA